VAPRVEFLWWAECPSWERALAELRAEMSAAGVPPEALALTEVRGKEDADRLGFPGSPTIRVGGRDVEPSSPDAGFGLTCRVYRRADGRVSPLPDRAAIRRALADRTEEERGVGS
jgi:hypothetical protein